MSESQALIVTAQVSKGMTLFDIYLSYLSYLIVHNKLEFNLNNKNKYG